MTGLETGPVTGRRTPGGLTGLVGPCLVAAVLVAACGGPILTNPPVARPEAPAAASATPRPADPLPIEFPRDDGPHDRLTEWWYYTGHLRSAAGQQFGFEFVVFRAERGDFPVTWASHVALTDETRGRFSYAQRSEIGPQVDGSPRSGGLPAGQPTGFDLEMTPEGPETGLGPSTANVPWTMSGGSGRDRLAAAVNATEAAGAGAAFGLNLEIDETEPVLHDRDGWIDLGPAGGSYYYSRPMLPARGTLTLDGRAMAVTGEAWFDHQWGDFIAVGGGGWDWFAVNLADGTDLVLWLVRDADGVHRLVYGTLRRPDGTVVYLADVFSVSATGHWTSPHTGAVYPAAWRIVVPGEELTIELSPTVADQELDTRPTSGVVYWEGSQRVTAARGSQALSGEAYVELTGYAPARPLSPGRPSPSPADSAP